GQAGSLWSAGDVSLARWTGWCSCLPGAHCAWGNRAEAGCRPACARHPDGVPRTCATPDPDQCPARPERLSSPAFLSCKQDHTMNQAPELLAPAGTLKAMRFAFAYGADAVYAGQPRYSLRVRENDFHDPAVLAEAIAEAHALGRKFYLASNISAHNNKVATYERDLQQVIEMGPDALIMS